MVALGSKVTFSGSISSVTFFVLFVRSLTPSNFTFTVIARNPKSLSDTAQGRSGFGTKTILDQAAEFVQAAEENQCFFRPPKVSEYNLKIRTKNPKKRV